MFGFFKPVIHTALTRSDWAAIDAAATVFTKALKERLEGLDKEIEDLRAEVADLRAQLQREPRQPFREKLAQRERPR